jgi:reactive intermediate/imine deaminase
MFSSPPFPVYNSIVHDKKHNFDLREQAAELPAVDNREDEAMKQIVPEYKIKNKGHYSPGILSKGMLYISGQLSRDPDTFMIASGGAREHAALALANIERVLREAGLARENVVQCRIYVSDIDMWDEVNEAYSEFFADHKPARCVVPCGKLHFGCLVEIEAVAEVPK